MRLHPLRLAMLGGLLLVLSVRLASGQPPVLSIAEGRLTLKVTNVRLTWILDQLTQRAKVAILIGKGAGSELVTIDLQDTPLDEALRQTLREYDTFFFYGAGNGSPPALQVVWVYPKGQGRGLQPVPPEDWASTRDLEASIADNDPETRLKAVVSVIERSGREHAMEVAMRAIADPDENVRSMALFAARTKGLEMLPNTLMELLTADSSASVRFLALEALARDPINARTFAEMGLKDPDAKVRHKAQEILTGLDAADRARRGETAPRQRPRR